MAYLLSLFFFSVTPHYTASPFYAAVDIDNFRSLRLSAILHLTPLFVKNYSVQMFANYYRCLLMFWSPMIIIWAYFLYNVRPNYNL
jgi:hypothetical protein